LDKVVVDPEKRSKKHRTKNNSNIPSHFEIHRYIWTTNLVKIIKFVPRQILHKKFKYFPRVLKTNADG